jgi:hypothetical protein
LLIFFGNNVQLYISCKNCISSNVNLNETVWCCLDGGGCAQIANVPQTYLIFKILLCCFPVSAEIIFVPAKLASSDKLNMHFISLHYICHIWQISKTYF